MYPYFVIYVFSYVRYRGIRESLMTHMWALYVGFICGIRESYMTHLAILIIALTILRFAQLAKACRALRRHLRARREAVGPAPFAVGREASTRSANFNQCILIIQVQHTGLHFKTRRALKRAFCALKRAFCALKRAFCALAVCALKRAFCALERVFCTLKRAFCALKRVRRALKRAFC